MTTRSKSNSRRDPPPETVIPRSGRARTRTLANEPSGVTALVYTVVGVGFVVSLIALLIARHSFGFATAVLVLLLVAPFLLYARLALARPGAEAVLGGVLLLAVSAWGSIGAIGDPGAQSFVRLSVEIIVLELVVFAAGGALRALLPPRQNDDLDDARQI